MGRSTSSQKGALRVKASTSSVPARGDTTNVPGWGASFKEIKSDVEELLLAIAVRVKI
jgi:hypothetical protein